MSRFVVAFVLRCFVFLFFCFNDTATTEIYTLSLHDALPISRSPGLCAAPISNPWRRASRTRREPRPMRGSRWRSEEHTSELQSRVDLVCRLLLEKKKKKKTKKHMKGRRRQECHIRRRGNPTA